MARRTYRPWLWALGGALGGATLARWQLARWFTQQPRYEIERRLGDLEIRVYGASWVAETQAALARLEAVAADRRGDLEGELTRAMNAITDAAQRAGEGVELRVETARGRVDQLNEIAFSAGQKADAVFESRMQEARDLVENAAQVVEQAGARTAQKLAESVETARTAIAEMERLLVEAGQSSAALPGEALARAAEVRAQIEKGIDDLRAAARRTAEETAAIDQAFQDRVRRNYEMLSEAVTQ